MAAFNNVEVVGRLPVGARQRPLPQTPANGLPASIPGLPDPPLGGSIHVPRRGRLLAQVVSRVRASGFLTKRDLAVLAEWKSPRVRSHIQKNGESIVRKVTRTALSTPDEQIRIQVLQTLHGVAWPVASVILHHCHRDRYPILDFRALWSSTVELPSSYSFPFWETYTGFCREAAQKAGVSMRILDRALWQYSKENQPPS